MKNKYYSTRMKGWYTNEEKKSWKGEKWKRGFIGIKSFVETTFKPEKFPSENEDFSFLLIRKSATDFMEIRFKAMSSRWVYITNL